MMKKGLIKLSISSVVAVVGVMGIWIGMPVPMMEQAMSQVSQQEELAEAERLKQQAIQLYQQGKYAEAIPLAEQALEIQKKVLRENHPDIAISINDLALLYKKQGRYQEAEDFYKQALNIYKLSLRENHPNVATSLVNLASLYYSRGRYPEAEDFYKQALNIYKLSPDNNYSELATTLNNLAVLYERLSYYHKAEDYYQQALEIRKQRLEENFPEIAAVLNNLAILYFKQALYRKAEYYYQQSLEITQRSLPENHPDLATIINNLAVFYSNQGRYQEAENLCKQALEIYQQSLPDNHPKIALGFVTLGLLYFQQSRYQEAEKWYRKASNIYKLALGENHPYFAGSLNNLAALYSNQGRYQEAEDLYKQALNIYKQELGENHPDVASSLINFGEWHFYLGRYREAEDLYKQALNIYKQELGENHPNVANSLNHLARFYSWQNRYQEAENLHKQALKIREKNLPENHPDVAISLSNLADLYRRQSRYQEAENFQKRGLKLLRQSLPEDHPFIATNLSDLALLYSSQDRYQEAEYFSQKAIEIYQKKLGKNHPDIATSLNNLAGIHYRQDNIIQAIKFLTEGLEIEEYNLNRNIFVGTESQKREYIAKISGTTNVTVSLHLQSALNNSDAARLALTTILQRKGRILDFLTNTQRILRQRVEDPETQELLNELIAKRTQLSNLAFKKPEDISSLEVDRELLATVEEEVKELEDKLSLRSAEFSNLSQPITLEKIQQQIPADTALVELLRYRPFNPKATEGKRFGKPHYAAYILYPNGEIKAIDLGEAEAIDDTVETLRAPLRVPNLRNLKTLQREARELDKLVMQPVRQLLGETKTILLSPDAALNLIPFEALVDENNQYLVENYQITYLTSGRDLLRQNSNNNRQSPLVMADPFYSTTVAVNRSIDISQGFATQTFGRLEGTAEEAKAIQTTMGLSDNQIKTKGQATENALKQVKNPDFLHIATHGFFLEPSPENSTSIDNPLFRSGLVFAGVEKRQSGGDDGVFTANEATLLNLVGTQLVVLSACDTGIGDISAGEGIYGLRRAFVIAGSESQLISLWKVQDEATKDLMVAYYQGLKAGKGRRDALLQIQRDWLKEGKYQHPYYWASFIFSGDSTPMELN